MHVYLLIFGATFSTLIIPLPEEIALLGAGYSARAGQANLWLAFLSAFAAIMAGDWITYFTGKALLPRLLQSKFGRRIVKPEWQEWATGLVQRHGARAIAIGRFLVALRGPVYLAIGAAKYKTWKFLAINGAVGLAEVGIVVGLGYLLGPSEANQHKLRIIDGVIAGALLLITIVIPLVAKRFIAKKAPPTASQSG